MRPGLLVIIFITSMILLSIHTHEAQGRRLRKGTDLPQVQHNKNIQEVMKKMKIKNDNGIEKEEDESKHHSSGKKKRKLTRVQKGPHHWLPRIHEDYYGPRIHRPNHH